MQALYTAYATVTGGRDGRATSSDRALDLALAMPKELGGPGTAGATNPEQLFAAGYAACFLSAMKLVGGMMKTPVPADTAIHSEVGIGKNAAGGFALAVKLKISAPSLERAKAQAIADKAHEVCPYSNATRGNIDVHITLD